MAEEANKLIGTYSGHTPQAKDLFMLGYKPATASLSVVGSERLQRLDKIYVAKRSNRLLHKSMSITIAFQGQLLCFFYSSCGGKKIWGDAITERDSFPMMKTLGVTPLYLIPGDTLSGEHEEWLMYDRKNLRIGRLKRSLSGTVRLYL